MDFKNWMENNSLTDGQWHKLEGMGYSVEIKQYSNKGPLFVILDHQGQEVGRAYFNFFGNKWNIT
jgi:hypothetical protein